MGIQSDPSNPVYYGNRAAAYRMIEDYPNSLQDREAAIAKDPKFVKAHLRAAKCYTELGRFLEATRSYGVVLELEPHNKEAAKELQDVKLIEQYVREAKNYIAEGNPSRALTYLDRASCLTASKKINIYKAEALLGLKEYDRAISMMTQILQKDQTNPDALYIRGFALYRTGNHSQASAYMKRLITYNPDDARAIKLFKRISNIEKAKERGNTAFRNGNYEEAIEAYQEGMEIDPENDSFNATLCCNKAAAYMKLGNYKDAITACTEAIQRDEHYVKAYKRRATCYTQEKNHEEAVRDLQQVKQMDPEDREIASELRAAKKRLKIAKRKDYYKILGLNGPNVTENEMKKAYKKKALKWHPDRWAGKSQEEQDHAEAQFKECGEALAVLGDPQKKQRYDNGEDLDDMQNGMGGADMSDIFSMFFGGGGMGGMGGMPGGFHSHGGGHSHGGFGGGFPGGFSSRGGGFPF